MTSAEAKEEVAKLVYVFTADDEKEYTGYIKKRKLWEGACDLNWPKYRNYRAEHSECELWTPKTYGTWVNGRAC